MLSFTILIRSRIYGYRYELTCPFLKGLLFKITMIVPLIKPLQLLLPLREDIEPPVLLLMKPTFGSKTTYYHIDLNFFLKKMEKKYLLLLRETRRKTLEFFSFFP